MNINEIDSYLNTAPAYKAVYIPVSFYHDSAMIVPKRNVHPTSYISMFWLGSATEAYIYSY